VINQCWTYWSFLIPDLWSSLFISIIFNVTSVTHLQSSTKNSKFSEVLCVIQKWNSYSCCHCYPPQTVIWKSICVPTIASRKPWHFCMVLPSSRKHKNYMQRMSCSLERNWDITNTQHSPEVIWDRLSRNSKSWKSFRSTTEAVSEMFASSIVQNGGLDRYRWFSLTQLIQYFFSLFNCWSDCSWHYKSFRHQLELWFRKMVVTLNLFWTGKNAHYAFMCFLVMGFPYSMTILWNFVDIISLWLHIVGNGILSCDIRLLFQVIMLCLQLMGFF
jgi:hypothetical protein